jgi:hypothetical protein
MLLTGQNRGAWRRTCPAVTLSITNPTQSGLGLNPGLSCERPATNGAVAQVARCHDPDDRSVRFSPALHLR